ncbi:unnamed protein product [Phytophthora lilii]|uniref:Unnamed protein product n=1 Tax=Phytophthora lilii TaxID=2077276 RepID=A0A9W6U1S1_9STRA|nr:unnamed protein product [Phytophthora lilii]
MNQRSLETCAVTYLLGDVVIFHKSNVSVPFIDQKLTAKRLSVFNFRSRAEMATGEQLFTCALLRKASGCVQVRIVVRKDTTFGDLKNEINAVEPISLAPYKLTLYPAIKDGQWLKDDDNMMQALKTGKVNEDVKAIMGHGDIISSKGIKTWLAANGLDAPETNQIHFLVQLSWHFSRLPPARLATTPGAQWDFQHPPEYTEVATALRTHYETWKENKQDKMNHPLFLCLDGPGTGKSRFLDEFPTILREHVFAGTDEDPKMMSLLADAFTFNINFETEASTQDRLLGGEEVIGARMLYQLQDDVEWELFSQDQSNHCIPEEALAILAQISGTKLEDMCVILCVDNMQLLDYTKFFIALQVLSGLVNRSTCWVIAIGAATISTPVVDYLSRSPQSTIFLETVTLSRPRLNGKDIFEVFPDQELTQLLVDDMGGHGRALETLLMVMSTMNRSKQESLEYKSLIGRVLTALRAAYPNIGRRKKAMAEAFKACIAHRVVDMGSKFDDLTMDAVISSGLINRRKNRLECP